ncbi:MAG: hypothetical protein AMXMBFR7_07660 [Planctomycetota bacterium]
MQAGPPEDRADYNTSLRPEVDDWKKAPHSVAKSETGAGVWSPSSAGGTAKAGGAFMRIGGSRDAIGKK